MKQANEPGQASATTSPGMSLWTTSDIALKGRLPAADELLMRFITPYRGNRLAALCMLIAVSLQLAHLSLLALVPMFVAVYFALQGRKEAQAAKAHAALTSRPERPSSHRE
ncbi:MAG TPA: hypothetical protein VII98_02070 [Solirubrobacteraceae bacterium]